MGKAVETFEKMDKLDLRAEFLELIEKAEQAREKLNLINAEIDLIVKVARQKNIDLIKEYAKM